MKITDDDRRLLAKWTAQCAKRVLSRFEAKARKDPRPRDAIEGAQLFSRGKLRIGELKPLAWGALAAAREVRDPIATAAARAAGYAAASPFIHALPTANMSKHILSPAVYAALAAGDDEIHWAAKHASPAVRAVLGKFPARAPGRSRLAALLHQLDAALRS